MCNNWKRLAYSPTFATYQHTILQEDCIWLLQKQYARPYNIINIDRCLLVQIHVFTMILWRYDLLLAKMSTSVPVTLVRMVGFVPTVWTGTRVSVLMVTRATTAKQVRKDKHIFKSGLYFLHLNYNCYEFFIQINECNTNYKYNRLLRPVLYSTCAAYFITSG